MIRLGRSVPAAAAAAKKPKSQVTEHTLTDAERRKFFRTIKSHKGASAARDYSVFRFMWLQGPRVGSVAQLTCGDVRQWLASDQMTIRDAIAKAGRGYSAPLRAEAKRELETLQRLRRKVPNTLCDQDDTLFLWGRRGEGMSARTLQQRMQKWREAAGLAVAASPHWLRHTCAYDLRAGTQHSDKDAVVGSMLGQSAAQVSRGYGQPSRQELIDAIPPEKH